MGVPIIRSIIILVLYWGNPILESYDLEALESAEGLSSRRF